MTRLVVFGDLHANWEALLALQRAEPSPDVVLCLGDIVGYGPEPKLCLDAVRANTPHAIGGWHDQAVGGLRILERNKPDLHSAQAQVKSKTHRAGVQNPKGDNELLEATWAYTRSVLSAGDRDYLASLPAERTVEIAGTRFHLARLWPDDIETETDMLITVPQRWLRERFGRIEAEVILLGGPHIPAIRQIDDRLIVCPGSLGQPRYGVPDPTFAIWQDGHLQIHHLHYQPRITARKLSLLPLEPEHILHLQSVLHTGGLD